jgi:hypothetical protein
MPLSRDPLSVWFDRPASRLLERAYASRGQWTGIYLAPPTPLQRASAARIGIWDLGERDKWGEVRWVRAFKRSVYHSHRLYGYAGDFRPGEQRTTDRAGTSLEWETGQRVLKSGWPSRRWAIRIRIHPAGAAALAAADRKVPAQKRWIGPGGQPTHLQSTPADRDWETG